MKKFIIELSRLTPLLYGVAGTLFVIFNPPMKDYDEDILLCFIYLTGVILSAFLLYGLSYVIEAACLYLEKNQADDKRDSN